MSPTPAQLAEALSSHRFEEVFAHLAADIEWELVGEVTLSGRDAVIDALHATTADLAGTATHFSRFVVVADESTAAVDAVATYTSSDGERSIVASCDFYEFVDRAVWRIRSYNVELD